MNTYCTAKVTSICENYAILKSTKFKGDTSILLNDVQRCHFIPQPRKEKVLHDYLCLNEDLLVDIESCRDVLTCKWRVVQAWKKEENQTSENERTTETQVHKLKNERGVEKQALEFLLGILNRKKRTSIYRIAGHMSQAPENVKARIGKLKDLNNFLLEFPSVIKVTEHIVTLVEHTTPYQSSPDVKKHVCVSNNMEINPQKTFVSKSESVPPNHFSKTETTITPPDHPPKTETVARKSVVDESTASSPPNPKQVSPSTSSSQDKQKDSKVPNNANSEKKQHICSLNMVKRKKSYIAGSAVDKKTVKFLFRKLSSNGSVQISQWETVFKKASKKVKGKIESLETMKTFLSRFPDIFNIDGDKVTLVQEVPNNTDSKDKEHVCSLNWVKRKNSYITGSAMDKKAVNFLFRKLSSSGFVQISQWETVLKKANKKVKRKMECPETMKTFLSRFPDIFNIDGDKVTLVHSSKKGSAKEPGSDLPKSDPVLVRHCQKRNSRLSTSQKKKFKKSFYVSDSSKDSERKDLENYYRVMFSSTPA